MARWLPARLILAFLTTSALAGFVAGIGTAQDSPAKKQDSPPRSNSQPPKTDEPLPATPDGGKVWVSPEKALELLAAKEKELQRLRDQIQALDRMLKKEAQPPSSCRITGRINGDFADLKVTFAFETAEPMTYVFLGLKNGFMPEDQPDEDRWPHIETTADGSYVVRVEKKGRHVLTRHFHVPLSTKKTGFELGLPGAAATSASIEAPASFKDLRANDVPMVAGKGGTWEALLGDKKSLSLTWKETVAANPAAAGPTANAAFNVTIKDSTVEITGDIVLEDVKAPLREWHLALPPQSKLTAGADVAIVPPDFKNNYYVVKPKDKIGRVTLSLQKEYNRTFPLQKLPVGPFAVQGATMKGSILIQSLPGALRGQRLDYVPNNVSKRNLPKSSPGVENLRSYDFSTAQFSPKGQNKAPLELEWKADKGQVDASVKHDVRPQRDEHGKWRIDVESRFSLQSASSTVDTLDMQVPTPTRPDLFSPLMWCAVQPSAGFPAALRWPIVSPLPTSVSGISSDDVDVPPADSQGRVRLKLNNAIGKDTVLKFKSQFQCPSDAGRFFVELPRLIGVLDRGATIAVAAPMGQELVVGNPLEPVQDRYEQSFGEMPSSVEIGWRESQRERPAQALVDLFVRGHSIQVRQTLTLPASAWTDGATKTDQLALRLPQPGIELRGASVMSKDKSLVWTKLPAETKGHFEISFDYDLPLKPGVDSFAVPLVWPDKTTTRDAKLRVWTEGGVRPTLVGLGDVWKDRPLEPGTDSWPAIVAVGVGAELPVALRLENAAGQRLPSLVAERSLVRVHVEDDGSQNYRCRYLVRKFGGAALDVELPVAWDQGQPRFRIAGKDVHGVKVVDPLRNLVNVPLAERLQSTLLEIDYRIPAAQVGGKLFWQTPLSPPRIDRDPVYGPTRWEISLPANQTPFVLGATTVDYRWVFSGWLLSPEPSVTPLDLDAWIGAAEPSGDGSISLAWWRSSVEPQRVYHFPRQFWLVVCSGAVLFLGLLLVLTPLPRFLLGLAVLLGGLGVVALGLFHEYLLPAIFFGCQPGLVVLVVICSVQWLLHERTRRQLVFMPSFQRVPQGSTVVRAQNKPPHNPSTIDAPAGSGAK